jgi:hypothetical protein
MSFNIQVNRGDWRALNLPNHLVSILLYILLLASHISAKGGLYSIRIQRSLLRRSINLGNLESLVYKHRRSMIRLFRSRIKNSQQELKLYQKGMQ